MRVSNAIVITIINALLYVDAVPVDGQSEPTHASARGSRVENRDWDPSSTPHPLDYAPDFSKDPFPPFPDVHNSDGSNITIDNWRGTYLFGWKGCDKNAKNIIIETYNDFQTLAGEDSVYKNLDWNSPAARDIWGHSSDPSKALSDDTKKQIKRKILSTVFADQAADKLPI
ncbi:MAG: hypothetical protein Q9227_008893 [Pyrenula ochraceoflavens]